MEIAKKWSVKVASADGFIIIAPEYNHGYPAVLKNALDYSYSSWNRKPVSFVSYGGSAGGARSVEQLRLVAVELQMAPLEAAVHIPMIWSAWDETGKKLKEEEVWSRRLVPIFDELAWWTKALKTARDQ